MNTKKQQVSAPLSALATIISTAAAILSCTPATAGDARPWSYENWKPGGERTTIDGITFDSTFQASYLETGRQLARGTVAALRRLGRDAKKPDLTTLAANSSRKEEPTPKPADRLKFTAGDFTAQLPWFYHGLAFDRPQGHNVYSFEVNGLDLPPGDYSVTLVPNDRPGKLAVGFDGRTFDDVPVKDGRVDLPAVSINNRMLSFYVKANRLRGGPLESVFVYPPDVPFAEAETTAAPFKRYRRDIRLAGREHLSKENWDEFYGVLRRKGFGKQQLRAMFNDVVDWCRRRQVLDPQDVHYGAIYSEEDKYDFRDAAAAAVCFTYAWRYMEHVDTKLRNRTDPDKAPFKRATIDDMTLCSWIQAVEWAGVLLREMEERLPAANAVTETQTEER